MSRFSASERTIIQAAFHDAARKAVAMAVRARDLVKEPCNSCGSRGAVEAHHYRGYDISHWLDVRWLCKRCHQAAEASRPPCECVVCALGERT